MGAKCVFDLEKNLAISEIESNLDLLYPSLLSNLNLWDKFDFKADLYKVDVKKNWFEHQC